MKNPFGKTRKPGNAYVVIEQDGWRWEILKVNQSLAKAKDNPFAIAFCYVSSPFCDGEYGDTYLKDIPGALESLQGELRRQLGDQS